MEHRYGKRAENYDFPHETQLGKLPKLPRPFGKPLFDRMLSYCSCLHLAQWLCESYEGEAASTPDPYVNKIEPVKDVVR